MKLVFQENPKFGDEQDVTQQIIAIDEHIEKLLAEIKRFEVIQTFPLISVNPSLIFFFSKSYIAEIERARAPTSSEYDSISRLRTNYGSDQSISNTSIPTTPSQNRR
jgi:hypothetical protein